MIRDLKVKVGFLKVLNFKKSVSLFLSYLNFRNPEQDAVSVFCFKKIRTERRESDANQYKCNGLKRTKYAV